MLKRKYRLRKNEIPHLARKVGTPFFWLKTRENGLAYNRFGFIISKNVSKRATARNRLRRMLLACVEGLLLKMRTGYDLLFILKRGAETSAKQALCVSVQEVLQKEGFL